jgi:hypothetical protein
MLWLHPGVGSGSKKEPVRVNHAAPFSANDIANLNKACLEALRNQKLRVFFTFITDLFGFDVKDY